jgi:GT2 family glycosyltransferase
LANGEQLTGARCSENDSIRNHIVIAKGVEVMLYDTTLLLKPISGFLMVIRKSTWDRVKFDDGCLGVDNKYHLKIVAAGMDVLRMNGIYVWHTYRLINGVRDKKHLI